MTQESSPMKALLWAAGMAALLLVTVVLPAEYGIDWTGVGRLLGLTSMGERKVAAAKAARAVPAPVAVAISKDAAPAAHSMASAIPMRTDSVEVPLAPRGEVEYKVVLAEGEGVVYEWDAGSGQVTFDFHGEPAAGPQGAFLSFEKGKGSKGAGTLKAPFAGTHGWYWRNDSTVPIVIRLRVAGFHTTLKKM